MQKSVSYKCLIFLDNYGAQGRDRTTDTAIFNRMLYQLSYLGAREAVPMRAGRQRAGVIMGRPAPVQNREPRPNPLRLAAET